MRCCSKGSLALLLALVFLSAGCSPKARAPGDLSLFFTCDTRGRLEPCGCFTGQHGGLTRLKTFLDTQKQVNQLLVDVGDALEGPADFQVLKYRYLQRAFAGMGCAALNLGARETQLSVAQLRELQAAAPVPMLSANVRAAATGERLCEPYRIVERGGYKIGLVGVVDAPRGSEPPGEGLTIEPMAEALQKLLPELKGRADFLILLAFADEAALGALARQFYEFDVILGGKVRQPSQNLLLENRSVVLFTTNESKALGSLQAKLAAPGKLVPGKFDIVFLHDQIPQDAALHQSAEAYRAEIRTTALDLDNPARLLADEVPGVHPSATFVGSASCVACHASAAQTWHASRHASAFASLVARRADADPSCIGCHTVGFGTPSGYRRAFAGEKLTDVGCESCHGPGSEHVAQRSGGEKVLFHYRPLGAADCVTCHHGEFSRPFNWDEFWPPIKHGRETAATP